MKDLPVTVAYGLEVVGRVQLSQEAVASLETGLMCLLPALEQQEDGTYKLTELSINPIDKSITLAELIEKMERRKNAELKS